MVNCRPRQKRRPGVTMPGLRWLPSAPHISVGFPVLLHRKTQTVYEMVLQRVAGIAR